MDEVLYVLELLAAIVAVVATHRAHRRALRQYPPLPVEQLAEAVRGWRWGSPPAGLERRDSAADSAMLVPYRRTFGATIAVGMGYALLAVSLVGSVVGNLVHGHVWAALLGLVFFGGIGFALINGDARIERVTLSADRAWLTVRYGYVLRRRVSVRRGVTIKGAPVSAWEMTADDVIPDFRLRIGWRSATLSCTPSQGSWLVAGLKAWADS